MHPAQANHALTFSEIRKSPAFLAHSIHTFSTYTLHHSHSPTICIHATWHSTLSTSLLIAITMSTTKISLGQYMQRKQSALVSISKSSMPADAKLIQGNAASAAPPIVTTTTAYAYGAPSLAAAIENPAKYYPKPDPFAGISNSSNPYPTYIPNRKPHWSRPPLVHPSQYARPSLYVPKLGSAPWLDQDTIDMNNRLKDIFSRPLDQERGDHWRPPKRYSRDSDCSHDRHFRDFVPKSPRRGRIQKRRESTHSADRAGLDHITLGAVTRFDDPNTYKALVLDELLDEARARGLPLRSVPDKAYVAQALELSDRVYCEQLQMHWGKGADVLRDTVITAGVPGLDSQKHYSAETLAMKIAEHGARQAVERLHVKEKDHATKEAEAKGSIRKTSRKSKPTQVTASATKVNTTKPAEDTQAEASQHKQQRAVEAEKSTKATKSSKSVDIEMTAALESETPRKILKPKSQKPDTATSSYPSPEATDSPDSTSTTPPSPRAHPATKQVMPTSKAGCTSSEQEQPRGIAQVARRRSTSSSLNGLNCASPKRKRSVRDTKGRLEDYRSGEDHAVKGEEDGEMQEVRPKKKRKPGVSLTAMKKSRLISGL